LEEYFDPGLAGARDADVPRAEDALKRALRYLDVPDIPVQDFRCTFGYYSPPLNSPLVRDYESLGARLQPPYKQYDNPENNGNENHRHNEPYWIVAKHRWMDFDKSLLRLIHLSPLSVQGPFGRQRPNSMAAKDTIFIGRYSRGCMTPALLLRASASGIAWRGLFKRDALFFCIFISLCSESRGHLTTFQLVTSRPGARLLLLANRKHRRRSILQ
jgi:hypothetical protein